MEIDILFADNGEVGLIASENFLNKAIGAVVDLKTGDIILEFAESDPMNLNIALSHEFFEPLEMCQHVHIGAVKNGTIAQAYQVPLMIEGDPYRGDQYAQGAVTTMPLQSFQHFIKNAITGQPIHRDDLGNDDRSGCILGDSSPSSLEFAPHLAKRQSLEAAPRGPSTPAPSGPGMGLGGSGGGTPTPIQPGRTIGGHGDQGGHGQ